MSRPSPTGKSPAPSEAVAQRSVTAVRRSIPVPQKPKQQASAHMTESDNAREIADRDPERWDGMS